VWCTLVGKSLERKNADKLVTMLLKNRSGKIISNSESFMLLKQWFLLLSARYSQAAWSYMLFGNKVET